MFIIIMHMTFVKVLALGAGCCFLLSVPGKMPPSHPPPCLNVHHVVNVTFDVCCTISDGFIIISNLL